MFTTEKSLILSLIQLDLKSFLKIDDYQQADKLKICHFENEKLQNNLE